MNLPHLTEKPDVDAFEDEGVECGFCGNTTSTHCHLASVSDGPDDARLVPLCALCRLDKGIECENEKCSLPHKDHLCKMNCEKCSSKSFNSLIANPMISQEDCEWCEHDEPCSEHQAMAADRAKDEEEYFMNKP